METEQIILPFNQYPELDGAVQEKIEQLRQQFLACHKENEQERQVLREQIETLRDTRTFCIVVNQHMVRHILQVVPDAETRQDEVKEAYYAIYQKLPKDEFHFCIGLKRVREFQEMLFHFDE